MIKFIDLFCGIGGFRVALEFFGCECVFSSDIDKYARETYKENFGEYPAGDITLIDEKNIPNHDILCAGFPCQPFSIGGKRLGFEDTRGTLFFDVLRILKEKRPAAFFLENVAGLCNHDNGKTIDTIITCLKDIDYIPIFKVINAKDVGYPQNRERWYCVGFDKERFPEMTLDYDFPFPSKKELKYTIDMLINNVVLPDYNVTSTCKKNIETHLPKFMSSTRYNQNHILIANEVRKSRCSFRCDGISPCLTAKMGTGGNNVPVVVSRNRKLTERECLRIMGYPDSYKIKENFHQSYKQIGNSVIVPLIKDISEELIKKIKIKL
jgi:DNA (cytosine-5-)-methyltransferase